MTNKQKKYHQKHTAQNEKNEFNDTRYSNGWPCNELTTS